MKSPLADLKVLEVASVLAGPAVGMYFAEHGAAVTKVENKLTHGDVTRSWKLPEEDKDLNISAYYCSVNWHKRCLFLDLTDPNDRPQLEELIKESDILIANFKYGDAEKFKLDFETVKTLNPTIIHAELSGFGSRNQRVAYDLVLQAETGFMYMNGTPDSDPVKMPLAMIDILAAHQLKEGILEALLTRSVHPAAYHVEASLYDTALATLTNQGTNYLMAHHIPQRIGSKHPNIAPYGEMFKTKDGKILTLAVGSNKQFEKLLNTLGLEIQDRFSSNKLRVENRTELAQFLSDSIQKWNGQELCDKLNALFVPVALVKDLKEVFESEEAQKLILEEETEGVMTRRVKSSVYTLSKG
ncbi:MAG: CoA transferase [Crocinitomicaceae bacterium]|nr:CoA transferase [Crocinitomicaceae bacterium]